MTTSTPRSDLRSLPMRSLIRRASLLALAVLLPSAAWAQAPRPGGPPGRQPPKPLPLDAARHANFTASKGTWISLDVSPDGKTIAFDLLGDLYTMPITGGKATRLTSGAAYDAQPRFSPDGKRLVFVSDRSGGDNLWTMSLDQLDTVQVTRGNSSLYVSPVWTPDGRYIVASRSGGLGGAAKLMMFQAEGGAGSPLPIIRGPATLKTLGAAFTPDGRYIWYAGRSGDWQYNALFPQYQLYRYDRETGLSSLMSNRYGSGFRPQVSPDGRWLVYGTRHDAATGLRIRELATGNERWLAWPVQRDEMESRAPLDVLPGYAFTPDSRAIVVSYGGEIWRVPVDGAAATKIPFEAEVKLDIGPEVKFAFRMDTTETVTARQIRSPVVSPDGRRIAFTAIDRLYVADLPDGTPRRLTTAETGEYHPVWSPDGRSVAYVTWDDGTGGHIMRVAVDGRTPPAQLTRVAALYYGLAWSPDGARIVATSGAARDLKEIAMFSGPLGAEFVWVPAAGGAVTTIAPTGTRDVAHFANTSDRIYAYSPMEGLVSFRWDGTDVKQHLRVAGMPTQTGMPEFHEEEVEILPRRLAPVTADASRAGALEAGGPPPAGLVLISPTGREALAQVGSQIYTVEIPRVGGPVQMVSVASPQSAPVPVRQLTDIGGEFPSWSADGTRVYWALGNAFATYDLTRVKFIEDSTKAAKLEAAAILKTVRARLDTLKQVRAQVDSLTKAKVTIPDSLTRKLARLRADSVQVRADSLLRAADSLRVRADSIRALADSVRAGLDSARADSARAAYRAPERRILVKAPRDLPRGTVLLRGGRAITMKDKQIIENADVLVRDNRIVAIGPRDSVEVPADTRIVDVTGKTLIPGFVDTHYHAQWLIPEIHPGQTWQYLTNLAYGVTTTRDPQTGSTDILSYQDRVETGGMVGPRIYSTGPGVFLNENVRDLDHAKEILKRYSEYWDTKTLKMYMTGNRQQRQWIIMAAKDQKIMPTTEGGLDFKLDLTHAMDGYSGIEHNLPVTPIYDDVVQVFKASQTTNSPTLLVSYGGPFGENWFYTTEPVHEDAKLRRFMPEAHLDGKTLRRGPGAGGSPGAAGWFHKDEYVHPRHAEFIKNLIEGGGRAAVGSHGQLQGLGYHWELWAMASGGLAPHDALRAATILGAEAIGFGQDVGSLEPGKMADILVLDADPLEDLRRTTRIRYVMKNGRLYEADTLKEIWPRERPLPAQQWQAEAPVGVRAGIR